MRQDPNDPNVSKSDHYTFEPNPEDPRLSNSNGCFDYDPSIFEAEPVDPRSAEYSYFPASMLFRDEKREPEAKVEPKPSTSRSESHETTATTTARPKPILKVSVPKGNSKNQEFTEMNISLKSKK